MLPRYGVDVPRVLASAPLAFGVLQDETPMMPLATFTLLLETAAFEAADPAFGFELGMAFSFPVLGPIASLAETAGTLGSACSKFAAYFSLIQNNTSVDVQSSDTLARWSYRIVDPAVRCREQDAAFSVAQQYSMLETFCGTRWAPKSVDLVFVPDDNGEAFARFFSCPVNFGARANAIVFPRELLDLPMRTADSAIHRRLDEELAAEAHQMCAALSFVDNVEDWFAALSEQASDSTIDDAAAAFGLSRRSFQRLLGAYGVTFLGLRNKVRARVARSMLVETEMPITAIALQLGYSETSAFCRWFKTEVGTTPSLFRDTNSHEKPLKLRAKS